MERVQILLFVGIRFAVALERQNVRFNLSLGQVVGNFRFVDPDFGIGHAFESVVIWHGYLPPETVTLLACRLWSHFVAGMALPVGIRRIGLEVIRLVVVM